MTGVYQPWHSDGELRKRCDGPKDVVSKTSAFPNLIEQLETFFSRTPQELHISIY
jgi:hypothetical protein